MLAQCHPTELNRSLTDKPVVKFSHYRLIEVPFWGRHSPSHTVSELDRLGNECTQLVDGNTWPDIWQNMELQDLLIQRQGLHVLTKHDEVEPPHQLVPRQILSESPGTRPECSGHCGTHTHTKRKNHSHTAIGSRTFFDTKLFITNKHVYK